MMSPLYNSSCICTSERKGGVNARPRARQPMRTWQEVYRELWPIKFHCRARMDEPLQVLLISFRFCTLDSIYRARCKNAQDQAQSTNRYKNSRFNSTWYNLRRAPRKVIRLYIRSSQWRQQIMHRLIVMLGLTLVLAIPALCAMEFVQTGDCEVRSVTLLYNVH